MTSRFFRLSPAKLYIQRHVLRRTSKSASGKVLVEHLERITRGLTPEDIDDLERIGRQQRRVR